GEMLQLNINSLTELCYLFLDDLRKKPEAGIINVGSTGSFVPVPYSAVYGASKSYVLYFTEALVGELSGSNVKVFCLCPSATDTDFNRVANDAVSNKGVDMKSPDEVAREGIDAFLSSGKHYVLTGRKSMLLMIKVFSRKKIIQMVTKAWRKRLGMNA
ncbi:MAG: SDR family NAD(P)-dependent oxidoreductase, partial [Bacteroidota bacterium]